MVVLFTYLQLFVATRDDATLPSVSSNFNVEDKLSLKKNVGLASTK